MRPLRAFLPWIALLLLAAAVRAPSLTAARPYFNYVDEGNYLHVSARMVRDGTWVPDEFLYPSLPIAGVAYAARAGGEVFGDVGKRVVTKRHQLYDSFEPFELLLLGRVLSFLASLGTVLLTGLLARRVAGAWAGGAGWIAGLLAALVPALAIRGGIAMIDSWATLFTTAALLFTERVRTGERPTVPAVLAGVMAGFAFASKYPAVLVCLPFALTVWLSRPAWRERLRLWGLGAAGAVAGAVVAMPGLIVSTGKVLAGLHKQSELYSTLTSIPLWRQVFVRAEWDLPFEGPELGWIFTALALAGLVLAVRDPRTRISGLGWTLYLVVNLALYASQSYQPFRNLLPLVPVACVLVALVFERVRERSPKPRLADAAALLLTGVLFGLPVARFALERSRFEDSRTEAVDWLLRRSARGESVLILDHLAVLPSELKRLEDRRVEVSSWVKMQPRVRQRLVHYLVLSPVVDPHGQPVIPPPWREILFRRYEIRARFGTEPGTVDRGQWHGNRQTVFILERKKGR